MVKNLGGNKAKGFARKNIVKGSSALRVATEEGEIYAQAVKVMGGSIASAIDLDGNPLRAHIRGKFRGRGKRDNFIAPGTWLLVGLHSWEGGKTTTSCEIKNCDILEVYNDIDKNRLKTSVTSVNWSRFITNDTKTLGDNTTSDDTGGIEFTDESTQEYEQLIANQASAGIYNAVVMDDGEEIDVDDI
jgi:hypothetical protein